jgi:ribosomal protein S18 acetylase RimI-like enzyme
VSGGPKPSDTRIAIRVARASDRAFVLETAKRLADFEAPAWRTPAEIVEGESRTLRAFFESPPPGTLLLIAESGDGRPLGFAYLETPRDYFTQRTHGHVGILAVAQEAEGRGAGGALLEAAEAWARRNGFRELTLNVFCANERAIRLYRRRGFEPETLRYVRRLEGEPGPDERP